MKPWKKIVLSLSMLLLLIIPLSANAEDKEAKIYDKPKTVEQGGVVLESQKYSATHYEVVAYVEESWNPFSGEEIDKGLLSLANTFFGLTKLLATWFEEALGMLYSLDILNGVSDKVSSVSANLWEALVDNFGSALLIIAVIQIFAVYLGQRNQSKAGKMTFKLITVFILATVWFGNSSFYLKAMNSLSNATQVVIMKTGTPLANADIPAGKELEGSVALLRNNFFDLAVYRPYLLMNYGTTNEKTILKKQNDKKDKRDRIEELLALKQTKEGYEKKKEIVQNEVDKLGNEQMTSGNIAANIGKAFISMIFVIILGVPLLIVALFNFIIQVAVIGLSIFLPIACILSMIPRLSNSASNVFGKLFGLFGLKALTGLMMLFIFLLNTIIQAVIPLTSSTAYFVNVLLTAVATALVIIKRDKIISFVTAGHVTTVDAGMPQQMYRNYKHRVEKPAATVVKKGAAFTGNVVSSAGKFATQKIRNVRQNRTPQTGSGSRAAASKAAEAVASTYGGPLGGAAFAAANTVMSKRANNRKKQSEKQIEKAAETAKKTEKKPIEIKNYQDNPNYKKQTQKAASQPTEKKPNVQQSDSTVSRTAQKVSRPEPHTDKNLNDRRASQRTVYQPPTKKEEE
ncbi:CD3337/EF1877 family mobilome membrane protein [Priestia megaterium]